MKTVANCVEEILVTQPFLEEALSRRIINFSALAEELQSPISIMLRKPVKTGAIMMALRRVTAIRRVIENAYFNRTVNNILISVLGQIGKLN